jgi:hypothetical protein
MSDIYTPFQDQRCRLQMEGRRFAVRRAVPEAEDGRRDKLVAPFLVPNILQIPSVRQKILRHYYSGPI